MTRIQISIDAITKDTYDKVRPGGNYDKIIKNIEEFLSIKKDLNVQLPLVRVNFVKTSINRHELQKFLDFWNDKVDMIGVQEFVTNQGRKPKFSK